MFRESLPIAYDAPADLKKSAVKNFQVIEWESFFLTRGVLRLQVFGL